MIWVSCHQPVRSSWKWREKMIWLSKNKWSEREEIEVGLRDFSFKNYKSETSDLIRCRCSLGVFAQWAGFGWWQSVSARSDMCSGRKFFPKQDILGSHSGTVCAQSPTALVVSSLEHVWANIFTLVFWVKYFWITEVNEYSLSISSSLLFWSEWVWHLGLQVFLSHNLGFFLLKKKELETK